MEETRDITIKLQDINTPLVGKYLGSVDGKYSLSYRIKTNTRIYKVLGVTDLAEKLKLMPIGTNISIGYVETVQTGNSYSYIVADVRVLSEAPNYVQAPAPRETYTQKDLAFMFQIEAARVSILHHLELLLPTSKNGREYIYSYESVANLIQEPLFQTWLKNTQGATRGK